MRYCAGKEDMVYNVTLDKLIMRYILATNPRKLATVTLTNILNNTLKFQWVQRKKKENPLITDFTILGG